MLLADCLIQVIFSSTSRARMFLPCEFARENFKFQAIFKEYLLSRNQTKITLFKRIFTEKLMAEIQFSTWSKIFLAQHLVETQICTLSEIFWGQKVGPESRHVSIRSQTEVTCPPAFKARFSSVKGSPVWFLCLLNEERGPKTNCTAEYE